MGRREEGRKALSLLFTGRQREVIFRYSAIIVIDKIISYLKSFDDA
jgi:hypothetical protein